jgi:hypothetical protein
LPEIPRFLLFQLEKKEPICPSGEGGGERISGKLLMDRGGFLVAA